MRHPTVTRWLCGAASAAALALFAPALAAQEVEEAGFALARFRPAPPGDRMFGVESAYVAGDLVPHATLVFDYAHNPLVLRRGGETDIGPVVSHQLFMHVSGLIAISSRVALNLDIPVALAQAGDSPAAADAGSFKSPDSAEFGDVRVGARLRLYGGYFDPIQVAGGLYFWLPTGSGDAGSFVGDGSIRGMPHLLVGGRTERIVWSSVLGVELRPSQVYGQVKQGAMLQVGAGAGYLLGEKRDIQVGPELTLAMVLEDPNRRTLNMELLVGGKYRFLSFLEAGLGLGLGLTSGVGTPDVRLVASFAYTPELTKRPADSDKDGAVDPEDACPATRGVPSSDPKMNGCPAPLPLPKDGDKDGIADEGDACPDVAGVASEDAQKNGCPVPTDRDKDNIVDEADACPDVAGVANEDLKKNGCPPEPDKDGDGVPDSEDACPEIAGLKTPEEAATNGCPGDKDGDTIRDDQDACPEERGKADPDPKVNGCPKEVRVTEQEIQILQQVQFDTGRATIKPVSNGLLDEVAEVIKGHPEITKIEVQGHTDNEGPVSFNFKLSQERATSVMNALVARGVDASRVMAKGYGPHKPIADNRTERGRRTNRRVEFRIMEKASRP